MLFQCVCRQGAGGSAVSVFAGRVGVVVLFQCVYRQGEGGTDDCVCLQTG